MGVQDIIQFDVDEYRRRVSCYDDQQLQKKEVVLIRTLYSSTAGVISGVVMAPGTGGASLVGSLAGGRMMQVVEQKLAIVRAELTRRGLPLHTKKTRDHAIPAATGGIAGAMGLVSGIEGHVLGQAAGAAANFVGVDTKALDRVKTAPDRPELKEGNSFQRLKRSLTETASSKTRSLQYPFTSEDKAIFRQYDNLLERKRSLQEKYTNLRENTLGAAGDKWYWYVVWHHPCQPESLTISANPGLWIDSLRHRDSLGQWSRSIQQSHQRRARDELESLRKELVGTESRLDRWQELVDTVSGVEAWSDLLIF
jgi:hypothetical protein